MTLAELAATCSWAFGLVLSDDQFDTQAMNAARQYLAWGVIESQQPPAPEPTPRPHLIDPIRGWFGGIYGGDLIITTPPYTPPPAVPPAPPSPLSMETVLTDSEWAIIKPLFMLYIERENARALEASRGLGVDPYGRDVNTVESDIRQYEGVDLPRLAFEQRAETILT